jgi:histidyl-tRNA synthetase
MSEKSFKPQKPKGTSDILPIEQFKWQLIENAAKKIFEHQYQIGKIQTPIFENIEVFSRSAGETSDVVSKEMYEFIDKGDRKMALRPEGTAGVVRAYVENKLFAPEYEKPFSVYYMGTMYRYERPQAGRMREFHQLGVESFGSDSPLLDVELITMVLDFLNEVGIDKTKLIVKINSLGNQESRLIYRNELVSFLDNYKEELSEDSVKRLKTNPLRILDSKDGHDQQIIEMAPKLIDYLDPESIERFEIVKQLLTEQNIEFEIDNNLVRGLDYYSHTIFEVVIKNSELGSASTIAGGGRYENMVEEFGGPKTSAIGFAIGLERLVSLISEENPPNNLDVYIVSTEQNNLVFVQKIAHKLRNEFNLSVALDYNNRSLKSQFKSADRLNAKNTIIIGSDEISSNAISVKDMQSGIQKQIPLSEIRKEDFIHG